MVDAVYVPPVQTPRERLLAVAVDILSREGADAVTIRRVAREAGLSHGAPLRHFPTRLALLSAVAAQGFQALSRSVQDAVATAGDASPPDRLTAAGHGYVEFALANAGVFELMFRPDILDFTDELLAAAGAEAYGGLVSLVSEAQEAGWHADRDAREVAGVLWAAMHGLSQLWIWGVYAPTTGTDDVASAIGLMTRMFDLEDIDDRSGASAPARNRKPVSARKLRASS